MGLTTDIGTFLAGVRYDNVPADAVPTVCRGVTDCVGVMLAGLPEPVTSIVAKSVGYPHPVAAIAEFGPAPIAAPDLALIYGTAAHALDYDDTGLNGHPSAVLVPAILAEAQEVGADGKAMIAAYVAGYEIWAEFVAREPDSLHQKGWHPSAMYGTVAAAGASAVLRKLDAERATRAIGIAASLASGVVCQFRLDDQAVPSRPHRAIGADRNAARRGRPDCLARRHRARPRLPARGVAAWRASTFRAPRQFGKTWRIVSHGINVKLYPMCFGSHRILDAMIDVCHANKIKPADIAAVDVEVAENSTKVLRNHRPQTGLEAKFSAEFAVAVGGDRRAMLGRGSLATAFVRRGDVQEFFGKVRVHPITEKDPEEPTRSPFDRVQRDVGGWPQDLHPKNVKYPRGHFKRGVERDVLWQKFSDCAAAFGQPRPRPRAVRRVAESAAASRARRAAARRCAAAE